MRRNFSFRENLRRTVCSFILHHVVMRFTESLGRSVTLHCLLVFRWYRSVALRCLQMCRWHRSAALHCLLMCRWHHSVALHCLLMCIWHRSVALHCLLMCTWHRRHVEFKWHVGCLLSVRFRFESWVNYEISRVKLGCALFASISTAGTVARHGHCCFLPNTLRFISRQTLEFVSIDRLVKCLTAEINLNYI